MKVDTHLNILVSFAYVQSAAFVQMLEGLVRQRRINVMVDSGAFTKHNAKMDTERVNVKNYCAFLDRFADYSEKYVMLDVIGNAEKSRKNYEQMLALGHNPMYVVTMYDNDYRYINEAVQRNPDICVAGGATTKGLWMSKRYQTVYRETGNTAKIHGLAFVTFPKMLQLPLASVDSSSWKASALRFGCTQYFQNGLKGFYARDYMRKKKKFTTEQISVLSGLRVTPAMFSVDKYHRGFASIEACASIRANIAMQKYCKRNGLDYFLAISNTRDLEKIIYVDENYNDLSYEKFRAEFIK